MNEPLAHHVMGMPQVSRLLGMIAAFDGRTSGESELHAWHEIATRGRWTYDEAREQVLKHFELDESGWLMPGRINTMIRMARQDRLSRRPVAPLDGTADAAYEKDLVRDRSAIMALWEAARLESKERSQRRRELVFKHPDLAKQLLSNLIGYSRPENWNGWIPPATVAARDGYVPNDSPRRAALVALVEEAERREAEGS